MLRPCHRSPLTPQMHAVRSLFHHHKLLNPTAHRSLPLSCFMSSSPEGKWTIPHGKCTIPRHASSSSGRGALHTRIECAADPGAPAGSDSDESARVWTLYDPPAGTVVTMAGGSEASEGSSTEGGGTELPLPDRSAGKAKDLGERPSKETPRRTSVSSSGLQSWSSVVHRRKSGKTKVHWVCENCGATTGQWWGTCRSCEAVNTLKRFSETESSRITGFEASEAVVGSWLPRDRDGSAPQSLVDVNKGMNPSEWRLPLSGQFGMEVARVLGGGIVPGSLILVGGDPGVGKSTLLLQIAGILSDGHDTKGPARVLYVSGEESTQQIANRADRMGIETPDIFLLSSTDIEDILNNIQTISPRALIVDSIQTVYLKGVAGSAGNIMQVKECTSALLRFAKKTNIPVFLIGHVTKTGDLAGPRILEHIVDVVLYMEGERYSSYRLLRSVKNRFGSIDELGVFEMSQSGLQAVLNPSEMFLSENHSDSEILAGLAVAVIIDGSRTFLLEIQALCVSGSSPSRQVNGIQASRAEMIISVLIKQVGLKLQDDGIFLNVVSGFKLTETAGDLAVAAAICSSFLESPIPNDVAFIGEIGLGGELRAVSRMDKRINAVAKLGYKKCIIPKSTEKDLAALDMDITIVGCRNLKEVAYALFQNV